MNASCRILIPLVPGVEELEVVTCIDLFRRAGFVVQVAGLSSDPVQASRGVWLSGDVLLDEVLGDAYDLILIPGGMGGVEVLLEHKDLQHRLVQQRDDGGLVAALCAGPLVLQKAGLLRGKRYTSHPSVAGQLIEGDRMDEPLVVDGQLVTSQGPGTAMMFALVLIEILAGETVRKDVQASLCIPCESASRFEREVPEKTEQAIRSDEE